MTSVTLTSSVQRGQARSERPLCGTVQAWMGHTSIATTNIYLHHLGTVADEDGLARLNGSGGNPGGIFTGTAVLSTKNPA